MSTPWAPGRRPILAGTGILVLTLAWQGTWHADPGEPSACAEAFLQRVRDESPAPQESTMPLEGRALAGPASNPGADSLPVNLFEARSPEGSRSVIVRFVRSDTGACGLIGGDPERRIDLPPDGADRADYILAVLSAVSGAQTVALVRPSARGAIEVAGTGERLQGVPDTAAGQVRAPVVLHGDRIDGTLLYTWEVPARTIVRNEAYVRESGRVDLVRETIATLAVKARLSADR